MAVAVLSPKDKRVGFAAQTTFGTAIADAGAFTALACEPPIVERDTKIHEGGGVFGTRNPVYANTYTHTNGSMPTFTIAGVANRSDMADLLAMVFQNVTEAATSPYKKTFTYSGTQADYTSDAGYFYTFIDRNPTASTSWKMVDCIAKSGTFDIDRNGFVNYSLEMVGRGAPSVVSNPSGTWTLASQSFWDYESVARATINFGSGAQDIIFEKMSFSFSHDIVPVGFDSGDFQTYGITNRDLGFTITTLRDAQTTTAVTNADGNTAVTINLAWGNATAGTDDGDLDFTGTGKITAVKPEHSEILSTEFSGKFLAADETSEPITVILADDTDKSW